MEHDFQWISKNDPKVKEAYQNLIELLHRVQDEVRDKFTFQFTPVGSYSRNMITYDAKSNVGFDFDFNIEVNDEDQNYSAQKLKESLMVALRSIAPSFGYSPHVENSTRVITIKQIDHFRSRILHSCDFAIVYNGWEHGQPMQQYIHFNKEKQLYEWRKQNKGYYKLSEKFDWLKRQNLKDDLLDHYIYKKNINNDPDLHSRTLLAIAVNEMCQKCGYFD